MGTKKPKSKNSSNGNRPRNGRVGPGLRPGQVERSSTGSPNHDLRTYSIPDYRLEHPDFAVRQAIETGKDGAEHVRY